MEPKIDPEKIAIYENHKKSITHFAWYFAWCIMECQECCPQKAKQDHQVDIDARLLHAVTTEPGSGTFTSRALENSRRKKNYHLTGTYSCKLPS